MNRTFRRKKGLICFGIFLLFSVMACEKKSISFGEQFAESYTDIVLIDTLTPELSTYKVDSFPSSGSGMVLLGGYTDPVFGKIAASSFFKVALPDFDIAQDALYDSLTLILVPNGEYYGDTTVQQQISVYELNEALELPEGQSVFYNTRVFSAYPDALGTGHVLPRPSWKDTVEIRLSNTKGLELFTKLRQNAPEVSSAENFGRYFRGIKLDASPVTAALAGYQATEAGLKMRLYYREPGVNLVAKQVDFSLTAANLQYNRISIDRSGTPLENLPGNNPLVPSSQLENAAYVQYAAGLMGKLTFPSLQNLLNIDKAGKILRAELVIKPVEGSFQDPFVMPPSLNLSLTDKVNTMGPVSASANLVIDYLYGDNTGYTFDITQYLQQQIHVNRENQNGLLIYAPSASRFNRLIIGDRNSGRKSRIQINIFYVVVK